MTNHSLLDNSADTQSYQQRLATWEKARFAPPQEKPLHPIVPTRVEKVPMRDGVKLYTEIFLPTANTMAQTEPTSSFPVILSRSPYPLARPSRHDYRGLSRYLQAGYAIVFQLVRGQGESEGDFRFFFNDVNDGYDAVQWLAEQPWCNGKVGMQGASYTGNTQLLAARAKPPALKSPVYWTIGKDNKAS